MYGEPGGPDRIRLANNIYTLAGTVSGMITFNEKIKPFDEVAGALCAGVCGRSRSDCQSGLLRARQGIEVDPAELDLLLRSEYQSDRLRSRGGQEDSADSSVPSGFEFQADVPSGDSSVVTIAQIWASSLAQIGVKMNINPVEQTTMQDVINSEQYTVAIGSWTNDTPDPDELMGVSLDYTAQNGHHSNYHSEEARNLVLAARKELDPSQAAGALFADAGAHQPRLLPSPTRWLRIGCSPRGLRCRTSRRTRRASTISRTSG